MMTGVKSRKLSLVGTPGVGHSWAYLPDLGRAFEALASLRATLGHFERFHFAGHHVTPEQMGAAIVKAAPVEVRNSMFGMWLLPILGLVDPVIREVAKMRYLWRNHLKLTDARLDALLGPDFGTPFEMAIAATVAPFFARAGLEAEPGANVARRLA